MIANDGKVPQYYVENSHPAIVQPWEFAIVQAEIKRRRSLPRRYSGQSVLATHIICGDCGDYYGSKTWHSTSKYRRSIWQCNSKFSGNQKCRTPHLDEERVKTAFLTAFNTLIENRDALIEDGIIIQQVYFEKENIYTLDSKGELLITIMSSLAQEESRSISENVTWGKRKQFADGKVTLPYKHFLGYRKGPDGLPQIVPEEAEIIRRIYSMFILGSTPCSIAKQLTGEGIPTPSGKSKWSPTTIESILSNEKYKGDALLQKTYTVDFLTKKMIANDGN